ncbi:MAG: 50S ribosomal protein L11 methyltransferase [Lachnospiraceae bacterium]|jgi:ribosomal protein L11 methyltransferase|nr:50S ribosomal protein L11 methyltransferase [Lachnospiraceae bacterium]
MKWKKFRIETLTECEDLIISALYDLGFDGAQIEDKVPLTAAEKERMFVDIPLLPEADDGKAALSFYVPMTQEGFLDYIPPSEAETLYSPSEKVDSAMVKRIIEQELKEISQYADIGSGKITIEETEDIDWINNWKQYFHSFEVGDFYIVPTWEEIPVHKENQKILRIDPGTAFGTGMHETTQLCIRELSRHTRAGMQLLDIGTGSGILGIAAILLGVSHVEATDLDECVLDAVKQNLTENAIEKGAFTLHLGNIATDATLRETLRSRGSQGEGYDLITANILAEVLVGITPWIPKLLKRGGHYITSGILQEKEEIVCSAIRQAGMDVVGIERLGEWVCISAMLSADGSK